MEKENPSLKKTGLALASSVEKSAGLAIKQQIEKILKPLPLLFREREWGFLIEDKVIYDPNNRSLKAVVEMAFFAKQGKKEAVEKDKFSKPDYDIIFSDTEILFYSDGVNSRRVVRPCAQKVFICKDSKILEPEVFAKRGKKFIDMERARILFKASLQEVEAKIARVTRDLSLSEEKRQLLLEECRKETERCQSTLKWCDGLEKKYPLIKRWRFQISDDTRNIKMGMSLNDAGVLNLGDFIRNIQDNSWSEDVKFSSIGSLIHHFDLIRSMIFSGHAEKYENDPLMRDIEVYYSNLKTKISLYAGKAWNLGDATMFCENEEEINKLRREFIDSGKVVQMNLSITGKSLGEDVNKFDYNELFGCCTDKTIMLDPEVYNNWGMPLTPDELSILERSRSFNYKNPDPWFLNNPQLIKTLHILLALLFVGITIFGLRGIVNAFSNGPITNPGFATFSVVMAIGGAIASVYQFSKKIFK